MYALQHGKIRWRFPSHSNEVIRGLSNRNTEGHTFFSGHVRENIDHGSRLKSVLHELRI